MPEGANPASFFHHGGVRKVTGMKSPHLLSRQAIDEFKGIYREGFSQNLSDDEAQKMALSLLYLFRILLKPDRSAMAEEMSVPTRPH